MITWVLLVIVILLVASNGSRIAKLQKSVTALEYKISDLQADIDRVIDGKHVDDILER